MVVQPPGGARAEVVDFGPVAPSGLDPAAYPLTGEMRTELFTWPRVEGDRTCTAAFSRDPSAVRVMRWRWSGSAVRRGATWSRRRWHWPVPDWPVDWYVTWKTANAAEDLRRYDESRRVWLPDDLPPVCRLSASRRR